MELGWKIGLMVMIGGFSISFAFGKDLKNMPKEL